MIIEPKTLTARKSLIDLREVNILLNLVNDSSKNVRLNTLDTLTHLPLLEQAWAQVVKLICQELQLAKSEKDKALLLAIRTWVPYVFNIEDEIRKVEKDPVKQNRLLDKVREMRHQHTIREDYDPEWEASEAPGFVLFSESELLIQKSRLESELPIVVSKLSNQDFMVEDPVLVTLLFEFAGKDYNYNNLFLINNLLKNLQSIADFRPDLHGLFEEYHRCVNDWIRDHGETNDRWFQLLRDDEDGKSWHSWQIAWTVSRGGLKGLISSLAKHLTADDETRQIAALALIADSADYVLQRSAAFFGGGMRPPRSAPHKQVEIPCIDKEDAIPSSKLSQSIMDENVQFTVYRPKVVVPEIWYPLLAFAHLAEGAPDAPPEDLDPVGKVREQAKQILADTYQDYQPLVQDSTQGIPKEGEITFLPEIHGCEFNPPRRTFFWQESVHREEFRMRAPKEFDGQTIRGRLSVFLGCILVAEVPLSVKVSRQEATKTPKLDLDSTGARAYRNIFASYSRKDIVIVKEFEKYLTGIGLGDRYLRDLVDLRAGEEWNPRLMEMIREANIFQLFWSSNSMKSPFVEQEWRFALSLKRPYFIRPTYWEEPFPELPGKNLPPEELRRLHFARVYPQARPEPSPIQPEAIEAHPEELPDHHFHPSPMETKAAPIRKWLLIAALVVTLFLIIILRYFFG